MSSYKASFYSALPSDIASKQLLLLPDIGVGVEIREMRVPPVVQSGSVDHVILDCNYDVTFKEGKQLDIKWFFGDDHQPFYQWLPGHR